MPDRTWEMAIQEFGGSVTPAEIKGTEAKGTEAKATEAKGTREAILSMDWFTYDPPVEYRLMSITNYSNMTLEGKEKKDAFDYVRWLGLRKEVVDSWSSYVGAGNKVRADFDAGHTAHGGDSFVFAQLGLVDASQELDDFATDLATLSADVVRMRQFIEGGAVTGTIEGGAVAGTGERLPVVWGGAAANVAWESLGRYLDRVIGVHSEVTTGRFGNTINQNAISGVRSADATGAFGGAAFMRADGQSFSDSIREAERALDAFYWEVVTAMNVLGGEGIPDGSRSWPHYVARLHFNEKAIELLGEALRAAKLQNTGHESTNPVWKSLGVLERMSPEEFAFDWIMKTVKAEVEPYCKAFIANVVLGERIDTRVDESLTVLARKFQATADYIDFSPPPANFSPDPDVKLPGNDRLDEIDKNLGNLEQELNKIDPPDNGGGPKLDLGGVGGGPNGVNGPGNPFNNLPGGVNTSPDRQLGLPTGLNLGAGPLPVPGPVPNLGLGKQGGGSPLSTLRGPGGGVATGLDLAGGPGQVGRTATGTGPANLVAGPTRLATGAASIPGVGASGSGVPIYPPMAGGMGGGMGGQQPQERERVTYLAEDRDVWSSAVATAPGVIGRVEGLNDNEESASLVGTENGRRVNRDVNRLGY